MQDVLSTVAEMVAVAWAEWFEAGFLPKQFLKRAARGCSLHLGGISSIIYEDLNTQNLKLMQFSACP